MWCLSYVEKFIRKYMPESLDIMFTPLLTLIVCSVPYILVVMPITGYISTGLCWIVQQVCMSESLIMRIVAGYISTALFLPMVAMGMHHGLVPCTRCSLRPWAMSPCIPRWPWQAPARWAQPSPST